MGRGHFGYNAARGWRMDMTFFSVSMNDLSDQRTREIIQEVRKLPDSEVDGADPELICRAIVAKHVFGEPPRVLSDFEIDQPQFPRDSRDAIIDAYISYQGDASMFRLYHSHRPVPCPVYNVEKGVLKKQYRLPKEQINRIGEDVARDVKLANEYLDLVRTMVPRFNEHFLTVAKEQFGHRVYEFKANQAAAAKLAGSGVKIRKPEAPAPTLVLVPVEKKTITIAKESSAGATSPEYVIGIAEYEDILSTMQGMAHGMERIPSVFAGMGEEALRWILLVGLNGIYKGQATAETFNGTGKTDVLIRRDDKNVFIAECLMWGGQKKLTEKMDDQLFKYAMWRDSKLALIVFNRGGNFTQVIDTMRQTIKGHGQLIKEMDWKHDAGARYLFRRHDDPQRHFVLTALAFDVPAPEKT